MHFVAHQQPTLLVAQLAQAALELYAGDIDAAFALNHFEHDGNHILVVFSDCANGLKVVVWNAHETRDQRLETGLRLAVAGCRQCCQRAPMKGLLHNDDGWVINTFLMPVETGQLDCSFVGLATRIAEEGVGHARESTHAICQLLLFTDTVKVRHMQHAPSLRRDGADQRGMVMPQGIDRNARKSIQIGLAVDVGNATALAMTESHWKTCVGIHQMRHNGSAFQ